MGVFHEIMSFMPAPKDALQDEGDGDGVLAGQVQEEEGVCFGLFAVSALQADNTGDAIRVGTLQARDGVCKGVEGGGSVVGL